MTYSRTVRESEGLNRRALSLGAVNAFDYAIQFLLPVVLVRCLDPDAFGKYRLLWLAAGTVMAVVTQSMAGSLYYYLPRAEAAAKRLYINQTLLFLLAAGALGAWAVSSWNPWQPAQLRDLASHEAILPAFILLWVVASLLDLLPTVEERVAWQAGATIGLSALRAVALSLTALLTRELGPVIVVTLAFVAFKVAVLLGYVARYHGLRGPLMRRATFADQLGQATPFSVAGALFGLRLQADQWVAAALFPVSQFASFSIATVLGPLVNLFRQSVIQAFLPSMSRLQSAGDVAGMLALNRRANSLVGALLFPLLAFAALFAEDIVTLVYTSTYLEAAPVMRLYALGFGALAIEVVTLMLLLRQGPFAAWLNLGVLVVSVTLSWTMAQRFGLVGAAAGSVTAVYLDLGLTLQRISRCTGTPVRQLQDWGALLRFAACACLAAAVAWLLAENLPAAGGPLLRVAAGCAITAGVYAALYLLLKEKKCA